jgi:hypothetical protein
MCDHLELTPYVIFFDECYSIKINIVIKNNELIYIYINIYIYIYIYQKRELNSYNRWRIRIFNSLLYI